MDSPFDRSAEDVGNFLALEHINTTVPDQQTAILFYIAGLGLTRDPYMSTGLENMWINIGRSQIHAPTRPAAQLLRGHVALVLPDRKGLLRRLAAVRPRLAGTQFAYIEHGDHVEVISPWGNRIRCFEPDAQRFGRMRLGMPYVEFEVPTGHAEGIARFYQQVMKAPSGVEKDAEGVIARVQSGRRQEMRFRETGRALPEYDGHHIQVYLAEFSGPWRWLRDKGLLTDDSDRYQYRFVDIVDPDSGKRLYQLEHEVRSMTHPLYGRELVNRDPALTARDYAAGYENEPAEAVAQA